MPSVTIDLITQDQASGEFVLILVEDGPWPGQDCGWKECLSRIQGRVFDAIDVAVDGHLAAKYPDSLGKKVRVQLDSPSGSPQRVAELVRKIRRHLTEDGGQYRTAIDKSQFIAGLSVAMGHERNPFN
jgi:hypothetical protein